MANQNISVDFLSADVALSKKFERSPDGELLKSPYPNAYKFTSYTESFTTVEELSTLIRAHSDEGHCLLKGQLQRPLVDESRRGSTDRTSTTQLLVLDLDGAPYTSAQQFLSAHKLDGVSHIVQHSASSGLPDAKGLSCHIFMLLTQPVPAEQLKVWLMHLNLTSETLRPAITLSRTGAALHWPVDITACQNDKLIYIAAPTFVKPLKDPLKTRIEYVKAKRPALSVEHLACEPLAIQKAKAVELKNKLRVASGMKAINAGTRFQGDIEIQPRPGEATITGIRDERGYVYFNLNGGDSWGYWHPADNFELIHNFKGEPAYKTSELLPAYYEECKKASDEVNKVKGDLATPNETGKIILAFRDFKTATYWNGLWDAKDQELVIAPAKSETMLDHYLQQHGKALTGPVPVWDMAFNPHDKYVVDIVGRRLNTYVPPPMLRKAKYAKRKDLPPLIRKIFVHAIGEDPELVEHFINWLAVIYQYKIKTQTAWILQGIEGTGKGMIANHIILPTMGRDYVVMKRAKELLEPYNGWMECGIIVFVDEMQTILRGGEFMVPDLKNMITEPTLSLRHMYRIAYNALNFSNWIFASNLLAAIPITKNDRRFNTGNFQGAKIFFTPAEMQELRDALEWFVDYMMTREADIERARTIMKTEARAQIINASRTSYDALGDAVLEGDLDMLWDSLPDGEITNQLGADSMSMYAYAYTKLIHGVVMEGRTECKLSRDDLLTIYEYCIGNVPKSPHKFTSLLKHYKIITKKIRKNDNLCMGIDVNWRQDETWFKERQEIILATQNKKLKSIKRAA